VNVQGSAVDVVMLGLDGFRVLEAQHVAGELELVVETTAARAWCRRCGVRALSKERPTVLVRDVDGFGRAVRLRWIKRRWRCPEPACPVGVVDRADQRDRRSDGHDRAGSSPGVPARRP
jgi:DNA-directed RNA polymerase subunit RPC12/RpoP